MTFPDWSNTSFESTRPASTKPIDTIPEEVMEFLKFHDWPGNIRELQNFIERAVVFSPGPVLRPTLTELRQITKQAQPPLHANLAEASRDHILEVLEQSGWLIGGQRWGAERLGLPRTTLIHKMRKLGIETRRSQRRPTMPRAPRSQTPARPLHLQRLFRTWVEKTDTFV